MILLVDNYDSFTYNLVQRIGEIDRKLPVRVVRNDDITLEQIDKLAPRHVILSPGPCTPNEAGMSMEIIRHVAGKIPLLGVCLGHQCIAQAFGGVVHRANRLMHGKTSSIHHDGKGIFSGLSNPFTATRYHSLIVEEATLPEGFTRTAWTDRNELMAIRHESMPLVGVQFHPESFLTPQGYPLIANFLKL
jgi:anthranilate synthase/aminodeoxychorismate synthase-like glutamine amidotransferase